MKERELQDLMQEDKREDLLFQVRHAVITLKKVGRPFALVIAASRDCGCERFSPRRQQIDRETHPPPPPDAHPFFLPVVGRV